MTCRNQYKQGHYDYECTENMTKDECSTRGKRKKCKRDCKVEKKN